MNRRVAARSRSQSARTLLRMACVIELVPGLPVIRVVFHGAVCLHDRMQALEDVLARQSTSAYRRLLVDLSDAVMAEAWTSETVAHASRLADHPAIRGMRIACIGDASMSASIESLAALRGDVCQRFRTQASALRWLCGERLLPHAA